jgi:hypothetical protein
MSRTTNVRTDDENVRFEYTNVVQALFDLIQPKDLFAVEGRATSKTTTFMARRSQRICEDMPGARFVLISDTFVNAAQNILPTLIDGWEKAGWKEGVHFVLDSKPPAHFKKHYKQPITYKHTIMTHHGNLIKVGSTDQPSGLAGDSFQHLFGDEARILKNEKLKRINPALRGEYNRFGHSVFYRGRTFFTDMPNIFSGDDDWIMNMKQHMDVEQAKLALQAGLVLNDIKKEILAAIQKEKYADVQRLHKTLLKWTEKWVQSRQGLTFFHIGSTFTNADILRDGYFEDAFKSLGFEEFKSAILSLPVDIKQGEKFYINLDEFHFFDDGINNDFYLNVNLLEVKASSRSLRYLKHDQKLEAGIDFGNMLSLVVGQTQKRYLYTLKNFYTLPPESTRELADQFLEFFKDHKIKRLDLYHDRSGNQYKAIKKDWATEIKNFIEIRADGTSTGWTVNLMSEGQATIYQEEEYQFVKELMAESNNNLPKLRIDQFQCKQLKSSLTLAKMIVKEKEGVRTIHKNKTSEKLAAEQLPMFSTNFSDAFKYFVFRPQWVNSTRKRGSFTGLDPSVA